MQINSSASTISLRCWFCRTGDLQNLIGCPIHYMRWHNHSSCTSDQMLEENYCSALLHYWSAEKKLLISRLSLWSQVWQNAKKISKQSNKEEVRLTERLTLQNLCAALCHNGARRRGKGDEPRRLEFWNKNSFYIADYLFWLKDIAFVIMVNQGDWRSENNSFSTDY